MLHFYRSIKTLLPISVILITVGVHCGRYVFHPHTEIQKNYRSNMYNSFKKINATSQKELELNATLFFSLSNASFSKTCNYYNNDILTLSHGINFMHLIQIDRFHSHL